MNILIIGSGGREHALAWKAATSPLADTVFVAPGNAGTAMEPGVENIAIDALDIDGLLHFAKTHQIGLTIVGPEAPLAAGIVDRFKAEQLPCFGPTQQAAQLETSKAYSKAFMKAAGIPTADFETFTNRQAALDYLTGHTFPVVIKASGLAAGKGVIIAETEAQACEAVTGMLDQNQFGQAGHEIIIEDYLVGEELSYMVIVDGEHVLPLASSQDHKRRDNGDQGPNTGGMGAYSPATLLTPELEAAILKEVIQPTLKHLKEQNITYTGFLYAGLMITDAHQLNVLEFNCRLGDPETQPILYRLQSDLVSLCLSAIDQTLDKVALDWDPRKAVAVVMTAGGYPGAYKKGDVIQGLEQTPHSDCKVFHAGTQANAQGIVTNGGRVLAVTALGKDLQTAQKTAYHQVNAIHWDQCYFRTDIAHRALAIK